MIDNIRLFIKDPSIAKELAEQLLADLLIEDPKQGLDARTKKHELPIRGKIRNLEARAFYKSALVKGSLHKFHNVLTGSGDHNYNDFSSAHLIDALNQLMKDCPLIQALNLTQLEFGLNIEVDEPAENIIERSVLMHKFSKQPIIETFNGEGYMKKFVYGPYTVKIYDKAKQYRNEVGDKQILRFEIKFKDRRLFKVKKVSELLEPSFIEFLMTILLDHFDKLMIVDPPDEGALSKDEALLYQQYTNPNYWNSLKGRKNRTKKYREKRKAQAFFKKHELLSTKNKLRKALEEKYKSLTKSMLTNSDIYKSVKGQHPKNKAA
ncbi:MAG: hypothetical protein CMP59_08620 [Flavobacteriales bacterium]|nr:hypothetical protein [Flavobacteriales bacterium]|tara:strand:- start:1466 stop:2428 length:963 start_codon:yes stop_codon:yes gene_type:complete